MPPEIEEETSVTDEQNHDDGLDQQDPDVEDVIDDAEVVDDVPDVADPNEERFARLESQLAQERAERQKAYDLLEKFVPKQPTAAEEPEFDPDSYIDDNFEPGSAAAKVLKGIAKGLEKRMETRLGGRIGEIDQRTQHAQMEAQESKLVNSFISDGTITEDQKESLRSTAWAIGVKARERGERPDMESSYKAAAFDMLKKRGYANADNEAAKRAALAKRKKVATSPGTGAQSGTGKRRLTDADLTGASSLVELARMHDDLEKS